MVQTIDVGPRSSVNIEELKIPHLGQHLKIAFRNCPMNRRSRYRLCSQKCSSFLTGATQFGLYEHRVTDDCLFSQQIKGLCMYVDKEQSVVVCGSEHGCPQHGQG